MLVDGSPEPVLPICNTDRDLVEVPFVSRCRKTPADLRSKLLAKRQGPLPHGLMAHLDASGREHLLDHPQAQGEAEVQPDSMADHFNWKAVAGVARMAGDFIPRLCQHPLNSTLT